MAKNGFKYCPDCGTNSAVHILDNNQPGKFRCLCCNSEFTTEVQKTEDILKKTGDLILSFCELNKYQVLNKI